MITLNANAKINLSLDVLRRREDGYHDVELIFNEISLSDTVSVALRDDKKILLTCDDLSLPTDEKNIAYRSAEAFFKESKMDFGAQIDIKKRIPHGAGLAGGSADAAAVLKALNILTGEPFDNEKLMKIGVTLGADVPFCIMGGSALAEGIGEILTPLPVLEGLTFVLAKPKESISTKWVYENLNLEKRPDNLCVQAVAEGIRRGNLEMIFKNAGNIMEGVTATKVPVINEIKNCFIENGAEISLMSGSGTTTFGVFTDAKKAELAAQKIKKYTNEVYVV